MAHHDRGFIELFYDEHFWFCRSGVAGLVSALCGELLTAFENNIRFNFPNKLRKKILLEHHELSEDDLRAKYENDLAEHSVTRIEPGFANDTGHLTKIFEEIF